MLKINGLALPEAKDLLGKKFSSAEAEAIYTETEGNPLILAKISEIDEIRLAELKSIPVDERALSLVLMAQEMLEKNE